MGAVLSIMIEGQEGLTWEHWRHLCEVVEKLGFESLWRSDHFFSVMGEFQRECIETWVSLALAAEWTERITFGPNVSPMTFRPPAVLARMATSVDILSGGRLVLGVGAGWYEAEHEAVHIPFPSLKERMDHLDQGIAIIREVWEKSNPKPPRGKIPLLVGGGGEQRTLRTVAREADHWGIGNRPDVETYRHKCEVLEGYCRELGRDPQTITRSVQTTCLIGRSEAEVLDRAAQLGEFLPSLRGMSPREVMESRFAGTAEQIAEQMRPYLEAGVTRWQLQHFLLEDDDSLELLMTELAPRISGSYR